MASWYRGSAVARSRSIGLAVAGAMAACVLLLLAAAPARATVFSNSSSIALNDPNSQSNGHNNATASPYPSTIAVSGMTGTISNVTLTLNNVSYMYSDDIDVLLVGPGGQTLIPIAAVGPNTGSNIGASNSTLTLSDAGTLPTATTPWGSSSTFTPVNYGNTTNGFNEVWESPAPAAPYGNPGPDPGPGGSGTGATFASQFNGINPNGTWSLYVITTTGGDGTGAIAGGWSLSITTASAAATTTTLGSSNNPSFTTAPSDSVTLTAGVSSTGGTVSGGTVDFTDGGTTISGCGAVAVSAGQATCTTSFSTEGNHLLEAQYSGTSSFGSSNATLTQNVNDHTTVNGTQFCNTGSVALNNPPVTVADASPYPSEVFVSGVSGGISHLAVTLNNVSYSQSQDIDALLVGPGGQSFILAAAAGPNSSGTLSNVTLTLDDSAASTIASGSVWGAANASVTSKPFNYGGLNETWGAPAPAGPYGNPGPNGGGTATLGTTFNGSSPNGTWSLYVITTGAGDGTGAIAGGWCANITSANTTTTTTTVSSGNNPSFTTAPGNSVTLTAYVTSTSTVNQGTVDFTDGGTTISGCGAVAVSAGQATCATSFSSEGAHSIEALYSGTVTFGASNATLSQQVDAHTTVTGNSYCNASGIALNNPTISSPEIGGTPYPSHVSVSGLPGTLAHLTVALKGVTYSESQDIDALLVGPGGQSLILVAAAGPNSAGALSNVTLTLDDTAASTIGTSSAWGTAGATVTSKPVNYGGQNEVWGAPAPAGPYGNPGPFGGGTGTLGSTFDGTNPDGTWSLYVITTAGGDGTGNIAGGWCLGTTINPATPTVTSQVASSAITVGGAMSDTATVAGPNSATDATPTGTVTFNVYGPNDPTCSATPTFTTTIPLTTGTIGPASAGSGSLTPTSAGTYLVTASYPGDPNYTSGATSCGDANETVVVSKASPSIATTASAPVALGASISDSATLSGGQSPTGAVTFDVYGPNDPTCSNAPASTMTANVTGSGTYGSGSFNPTAAGTYRWVASYGGDANNGAASGACNDSGESVVVAKASPSLATTASAAVPAGASISDSAALSGGHSPTGTITFNVYGPGDLTCANAPAFSATAAVSGSGTYGSGSFTATQAGTYRWVASYGGDANNGAAPGACNDSGESVVVSKASPSLATQASPAVPLGGSVTDTATIAGGDAPGGQVVFKLYGPGDTNCSAAPAFTSSPVTVSGDGAYTSPSFTPAAVGSYRWTAAYSGDANNGAAATSCGDTGESVAVGQVATLTTLTSSPNPSRYRQPVSFTAAVSGDTPTGTVTFKDGSVTLGTGGLGAGGTATFTATRLRPGRDSITALYAGDARNAGSSSTALVQVVRAPSNRFTVSHITPHADGTLTFDLKLPGPGSVEVTETAWKDNFAAAASLLQPAPGRFVFARRHLTVDAKGTVHVTVIPNAQGRRLIAHHRYRVVIRLWVSYISAGGLERSQSVYGAHFPPDAP